MSDDFEDDDDTDTSSITVVIDYVQNINVIRFLGGAMTPTKLTIRAEVIPSTSVEEIDFDVTFAKIKFWLETVVARSMIFCKGNEIAYNMLIDNETGPRMSNHMIMTPYEPTDEHLAVLLQSKMSALSGGSILFGHIEVKADTSGGLIFTYLGDWENDLPEMKDWFAQTPYWFDKPWWTRNDASTVDLVIGEFDPEKTPSWAFKLDFIENAMRPRKAAPEKTEEEVVVKFRPKIIDGGKDAPEESPE